MVSYAVIMAGGTGTRLWPLSRLESPKQTHSLIGERTMFQNSIDRLLPLFGTQQILVVAGKGLISELMQQMPEIPSENYIIEPEGKGTAPCIGLAAANIGKRDPEAVMVVVTADHHIGDVECFQRVLNTALKVSEKGHLVTLGITPTHPSTGYGYIKHAEKLYDINGFLVFRVDRFIEKPKEEYAIRMLQNGGHSWNSGMFIWRVDRIMKEFQRQMPKLYNQLSKISESVGYSSYEEILVETWSEVEKQTIDYGVMEGAGDVVVIPLEMGWSDIGTWSSLSSLLPNDDNGNMIIGNHIGIDTSNSLIFGTKRLIATIGLNEMIIVDTDDALLVCPKSDDQKVREIVNKLRENSLKNHFR